MRQRYPGHCHALTETEEIFDHNLDLGQPSMSTVFPHHSARRRPGLAPPTGLPVINLLVLYENCDPTFLENRNLICTFPPLN